ncbi:hypothetical protein [Bosea sp. RAC05]|uniref:hypothetical protein n=1 Tax=Bosea sp. RAC05 TaxID=1842539 RepID=UPI00083DDBF4|nr:hypothetical protein [Bosea sp. RAC05]AOG02842.1 hypothetical protein BSY19_4696 [Bosea sp. RAC05]
MSHRETYLGNIAVLAEFIRTNRNYALPSDSDDGRQPEDPRAINASLETLVRDVDHGGGRYWDLMATALELFLRKAPELRETMLPIASAASNISREAVYDPLTYRGLMDVLHFISNGLLDDWWLALYQAEGERRIVNETIDDAIQLGRTIEPYRIPFHLDKDEAWFAAADRTKLSFRNFYSAFGHDLIGVIPRLWSEDDLMNAWLARPYLDFTPVDGLIPR